VARRADERLHIDGAQVVVTTAVDPLRDTLAVRIAAPLLARGLAVRLALPRGYVKGIKQNPPLDWSQPDSHTTTTVTRDGKTLVLAHARDGYRYGVALRASTPVTIATPAPHTFEISPASGQVLEFTLAYAPDMPAPGADAPDVLARSAALWPTFWQSGGAVDFSGSKDPRAAELERRVVLSQYLTAIQFGGDFPPQESGLTTSTWYVKDGNYVALESIPDTWDDQASRQDHPSFLMALGQLPGAGVDRAVIDRTLDAVLAQWDWKAKIWGWDYPMIAMTAARLGRPDTAVDVLLKTGVPNNGYTAAGHNPNTDLPVYLPGNGALLAAVAMMAGGWDGAPARPAPGFPGDWTVRAEGLVPLP